VNVSDFVHGDSAELESVGLAIAVVLLLALRLLLPPGGRKLVVQPALLLLFHVGARLLAQTLTSGTSLDRGARVVGTVLLLWSLGRSAVLLSLEVGLGRRMRRPPPRIVRDLAQALVYAVILLVALRAAGVDPASILTTSALLTAVIALSLQETLGNMFAGLAIQMQRPFDVDDWIQFDTDTKHIGRVIEINWRATKVVTLDLVEVIIPNSTLAKAALTNFTKPTRASRRSLYAYARPEVAPHFVHGTILEAIGGSFGVLAEPAPSVVTNAFVDGNVEYWVRFFTEDFDERDRVDGTARDRIWYAFSRAGIAPAPPSRVVHLQEASSTAKAQEAQAQAQLRTGLRGVDFLRALTEEQLDSLAARTTRRMYVAGEAIVRQGEASAEMFVVEAGEVVVTLDKGSPAARGQEHGVDVEIARLGPGKFFGEMSLMTGEPRNATVRAAGPCTLLVLGHAAFRALLESAPDLAEHVSRVITERQAALAGQAAAEPASARSVQERSSLLLDRIKRFFSL
jgi:small-conductance mechanosensitive channel/CRP-like cAMP-binding protein